MLSMTDKKKAAESECMAAEKARNFADAAKARRSNLSGGC